MKTLNTFLLAISILLLIPSCVSKKKLNEANAALEAHKSLLTRCEDRSKDLEAQLLEANRKLEMANAGLKKSNDELVGNNARVKALEDQIVVLKSSQGNLLEQLNTASVLNKAGAESIKKSLEAINMQSGYIQELD
jgi:chemotaxis protein MotB